MNGTTRCSTGFRIFARAEQVQTEDQAEIMRKLRGISSTAISDATRGLFAVDPGIRLRVPLRDRVVGRAHTVSVTPGNGLMIRKAVALARAGDVIVVNAFGNSERAVLGANVAREMVGKGVAALIVDGAVRDISEIATLKLPIFARHVTPRSGSDLEGRGEIGAPISCGGVVVCPDDFVVADDDGIVVVPSPDAERVAAAAEESASSKRDAAGAARTMLGSRTQAKLNFDETLATAGIEISPRTWFEYRVGP